MKRFSSVVAVPLLALVGCWGGSVSYYSLQPSAESARYVASERGPVVEVRKIRFPSYLNNPQMVTRLNGGEMAIDESHRWVEDLGVNFQRVFIQDLAARLNSSSVFVSGYSDETPHRIVQVEVTRFDVDRAGNATLNAHYTISAPGSSKGAASVVSVLEGESDGKGPRNRVEALSTLVDRLAGEVAGLIAQQH